MIKRRLKISASLLLLMLLGISLSFSTLHSHHNLELHNSKDFADTGHCISADTTLCPICAHLLQSDDFSNDKSIPSLAVVNTIAIAPANTWTPLFYIPSKGRSPPVLG